MEISAVDDAGNEYSLSLSGGRIQVLKPGRLGPKEVMSRWVSAASIDDDSVTVDGRVFTPRLHDELERFAGELRANIATEQGQRPEAADELPIEFRSPIDARGERWQYAVVNIGAFNTSGRMAKVLGEAGENGWELTTVFDKQTNWIAGMEKGFMLFRRSVPSDAHPTRWVVEYRG